MALKCKDFACILYPDCNTHKMLMEFLPDFSTHCIFALHDKDIDESGSLKKIHYHCVFSFDSPRSYGALEDILSKKVCKPYNSKMGFSENFSDEIHIEPVSNLKEYMKYLTHSDSVSRLFDKYEYNSSCFSGDLHYYTECLGDDEYELNAIMELCDSFSSFHDVARVCASCGLLKTLRKNSHFIHFYLESKYKKGN